MSVHVDQVTSEVIPEPEAATAGEAEAGSWTWADEDRFRALQRRTQVDRARTRAEGFDA
jgi:hypothetical protein